MIDSVAPRHRPTLVAALPDGRLVTAAVVLCYAALVGLAAQVVVPLPFTPVPITGQTFAVLVGAMALGLRRGVAGMGVYLALGLAGVPWLAAGHGGPGAVLLPSFGYVVGFVVAAAVTGRLADRGWALNPFTVLAAMIAGNLAIYVVGATWLMLALRLSPQAAVYLGVAPFIAGDLLKVAAAMAILPLASRLAVPGSGRAD